MASPRRAARPRVGRSDQRASTARCSAARTTPDGIFALEGARLMPTHDLSFKLLLGYAQRAARRSRCRASATPASDTILDYLVTLDMAFGMTLTDRHRDRHRRRRRIAPRPAPATACAAATPSGGPIVAAVDRPDLAAPAVEHRSVGEPQRQLGVPRRRARRPARCAVRPQVRARRSGRAFAVTAVGSVFLPFGDDEMLLGDRNLVFEPKLAARLARAIAIHATRARRQRRARGSASARCSRATTR